MQTLATEAFQRVSGSLIWIGLLHSLWLGLVMAALVALVFQICRTLSHQTRHAILLAALGVVAFSPFVLTVVQYHVAGGQTEAVTVSAATAPGLLPGQATSQLRGASSAAVVPRPGGLSQTVPLFRLTLDRVVVVVRAIRPYALLVWALVVFGLSAMLALGAKGLNQLCRNASPAPPVVREQAQKLGRLLRLRMIPVIRVHPTLDEPCLCGVFRPVILLPERWLAAAGPESLEAVLAHELAHARRSDHLVNLVQRVLESLLFFHPGVHWLSRSLRCQRELCADALAVRLTGDPLALARALESVARLRVGPPPPRLVGAAFGGESSSLLHRIQELIGMTPNRPRPQVWPFAALPSAVAVALVAVSIGFAKDEPAPSRPLEATPTAHQSEDTRPAPVPAIPKAESVRQISYEVRFINLEPDAWRQRLKGQLRAVESQADMTGWVIDQSALTALLNHIQGEATASHLQAPKVTTFENDHAFIDTGPEWICASSGNTRQTGEDRGTDAGIRVNVGGSHLPQGMRLTVEVSDTKSIPRQGGEDTVHATTVVRSKGTSDVLEDSSLVVSLGRHAHGSGPRSVMSERIVIITPRRIVLDAAKAPMIVTPSPPIRRPPGR